MSIKDLQQAKRLLETIAPIGESLAFINKSEARALKKMGGSGHLTEAGIPSYFGGIGSKFKKRIRKIIPNEVSKVAVKLAPFIAPFNPALAAAMAGIGGFDQTGRIGDSLKSGLKTYAMGQGARVIGGAGLQGNPFASAGGPNTFMGNFGDAGAFRGDGFTGSFSSPMGESMFNLTPEGGTMTQAGQDKLLADQVANQTVSPMSTTGDAQIAENIAGNQIPSGSSVTSGGDFYYPEGSSNIVGNVAQEAGSEAAKTTFREFLKAPLTGQGGKMEMAAKWFGSLDNYTKMQLGIGTVTAALQYLENQAMDDPANFPDFSDIKATDYNRNYNMDMYKADGGIIGFADGGRIGLEGGGGSGSMFVGLQGNVNISSGLRDAINSTYYGKSRNYMIEKVFPKLNLDPTAGKFIAGSADGGIIGLANGGEPSMEMDYRGGGFIPVGSKERADDVPARLSKNEFVMTADAVRAAGGGSVSAGADRMYNLMNQLEAQA